MSLLVPDGNPENSVSPNDESGHRARRGFAIMLVAVLLVVFVRMVGHLLIAVLGGLVMWAMTRWIFDRAVRLLRGRRGLAAGLTVLATVLLFVVPAGVLIYMAVADASNMTDSVRSWLTPRLPEINRRIDEFTRNGARLPLGIHIDLRDVTTRLQQGAGAAGEFLLAATRRFSSSLFELLMLVFVALYSQFFFCLDGDRFLGWFTRLLPLSDEQSRALVDDFFGTSRSTLKTLAVIGAIQGGLGGLAFWAIGIPAPMFWTVVMAIASAIPSVGAQLVLVPASIILLLVGNTWAGIGLLLWSLVVISSVDNLVRPIIVRHDVDMHELLVLVSTLGGVATFGFFGVIIGPIIGAMLKASLEIYGEIYGRRPAVITPEQATVEQVNEGETPLRRTGS